MKKRLARKTGSKKVTGTKEKKKRSNMDYEDDDIVVDVNRVARIVNIAPDYLQAFAPLWNDAVRSYTEGLVQLDFLTVYLKYLSIPEKNRIAASMLNARAIQVPVVGNVEHSISMPLRIAITPTQESLPFTLLSFYYCWLKFRLGIRNDDNPRLYSIVMERPGGQFIYIPHTVSPIDLLIQRLSAIIQRYEESGDFDSSYLTFTSIKVVYLDIPRNLSQGGSRTFKDFSRKHLIVETFSKGNCFWNAAATGAYYLKDDKEDLLTDASKRQQSGKNLKKRVRKESGLPLKNVCDEKDYQACSDYLYAHINLYNGDFVKYKTFSPRRGIKAKKRGHLKINICLRENHARLLLDKDDVLAKYPNFKMPKATEITKQVGWTRKKRMSKKNTFSGKTAVYMLKDGTYSRECVVYDTRHDLLQDVAKSGLDYIDKVDGDCTMIKKSKDSDKRLNQDLNTKLASLDLETCVDHEDLSSKHQAYAAGFSYKEGAEYKFVYKWGYKTCVKDLVDWIHDHMETLDGYTVAVHNGSKFDFYFMLDECLYEDDRWTLSILENSGKIITMTLKCKETKAELKFVDTLLLMPSSLDALTKELKVAHPKLTGDVTHHKITSGNYDTFKSSVIKYLKNDCLGLLEVYEVMVKAVHDNNKGMRLTDYLTGSSLGINTFWNLYYDEEHFPLFNLNEEVDEFIRSGYFGGRTEVFQLGLIEEPVYYVDENSMYPKQGTRDMPYGKPVFIEGDELYDYIHEGSLTDNFFGFCKVRIKSKYDTESNNERRLMLHGYKLVNKAGNKLVFPEFKGWSEPITLFSEELKLGYSLGLYEYDFLTLLKFKRGPIMSKFFNEMYDQRRNDKKEGRPAMAQVRKIISNSSYGRFAMVTRGKDSLSLKSKNDPKYISLYHNEQLISITQRGEYTLLRALTDIESKDCNVAVAAAITSYGRMALFGYMSDVISYGGSPLYCDTDSVQFTMSDASNVEKLMSKWNAGDPKAEKLGSMKNEFPEKLEGALSKAVSKGLIQESEKDHYRNLSKDYNQSFSRCAIVGAKQYFLERRFDDKVTVIATAFKGLSRRDFTLTIDHYLDMLKGEVFVPFPEPYVPELETEIYIDEDGDECEREVVKKPVGQLSFRGGKSTLMTEIEKDSCIRITYDRKKFKLGYTKGEWDEDELQEKGRVLVKPCTL